MRPAARSRLLASAITASLLLGLIPATRGQEAPFGVGVEVPYVTLDGINHGTVMIKQLDDPFLAFDPSRPPEEGKRYVGIIGVFTAADDQTLVADPYHLALWDAEGYLYFVASVPRPADVIIPVLQGQVMAPGNRLSGFLGFIVPEDAQITQVLYWPSTYRVITLVDKAPGGGPAPGTDVAFVSPEGARLTITTAVDEPFTGHEPAAPPQVGERYVAAWVTVVNSGSIPIVFAPGSVQLVTDDGQIFTAEYIRRPLDVAIADLEGQTLSPGDRISGLVGFSVPTSLGVEAILFYPRNDRRVVLAELGGQGGPAPAPSEAPLPSEAPAPTPAASAAPPPSAGPTQPAPSAGTSQ